MIVIYARNDSLLKDHSSLSDKILIEELNTNFQVIIYAMFENECEVSPDIVISIYSLKNVSKHNDIPKVRSGQNGTIKITLGKEVH